MNIYSTNKVAHTVAAQQALMNARLVLALATKVQALAENEMENLDGRETSWGKAESMSAVANALAQTIAQFDPNYAGTFNNLSEREATDQVIRDARADARI